MSQVRNFFTSRDQLMHTRTMRNETNILFLRYAVVQWMNEAILNLNDNFISSLNCSLHDDQRWTWTSGCSINFHCHSNQNVVSPPSTPLKHSLWKTLRSAAGFDRSHGFKLIKLMIFVDHCSTNSTIDSDQASMTGKLIFKYWNRDHASHAWFLASTSSHDADHWVRPQCLSHSHSPKIIV